MVLSESNIDIKFSSQLFPKRLMTMTKISETLLLFSILD